jgi:hypothetical protein
VNYRSASADWDSVKPVRAGATSVGLVLAEVDVIFNWFLHTFGLDDGSGAWYLFWSGIVGDVALLGTLFVLLRRLNCHASGCWRIGIHRVVGTPYVTCRKHHPVVPTGG